MHWLYWAEKLAQALEKAGFEYDSTFGYNDAIGFRAGTTQAFCKIVLDIHDSVPETYVGKFGAKSGRLFKLLSAEEHLCCLLADKIVCVNHVQRRTTLVARGIPINKLHTVITMPTFPDGPTPKASRDYWDNFSSC